MTKVRQILARKGSNAIESVSPDSTLAEAAARLSNKKIGCLLALGPGGDIAGILSERDIVRVVGRDGPERLKDSVGSVMTAKVQCCDIEDDAFEVLARMTAGRFRHMPVTEKGRLAGLISIGDAVNARLDELKRENDALADMIRSATA